MTPKDIGDVAAGSTIFGSLFSFLPEIAALFGLIWTVIRIYEWVRFRIFHKDDKPSDL